MLELTSFKVPSVLFLTTSVLFLTTVGHRQPPVAHHEKCEVCLLRSPRPPSQTPAPPSP